MEIPKPGLGPEIQEAILPGSSPIPITSINILSTQKGLLVIFELFLYNLGVVTAEALKT